MKPLDPAALEQVERRLHKVRGMAPLMKVKPGWLTYMRTALCMPLKNLAKASGLSSPSVKQMEKREELGKVTIDSMRKLASAMDCEFVYAIIPKQNLKKLLEEKAKKKAIRLLEEADIHMVLEDQQVKTDLNARVNVLAKILFDKGDVW